MRSVMLQTLWNRDKYSVLQWKAISFWWQNISKCELKNSFGWSKSYWDATLSTPLIKLESNRKLNSRGVEKDLWKLDLIATQTVHRSVSQSQGFLVSFQWAFIFALWNQIWRTKSEDQKALFCSISLGLFSEFREIKIHLSMN